ncbi:hypothetical protein U3516DRAFT_566798 [Neocallimastix sp. 'constans']
MDIFYQLKPLINNLNNTTSVITREKTTEQKKQVIVRTNTSFISPSSIEESSGSNSPYSFDDILTDNDKERIDMVYDNSAVNSQGVNNTYSLDLNLSKKEILELVKYFFSIYTLNQDEATELKRKIKNYSTEGLVKDLEYYINLLEKDAAFIKNENFSSFDKYELWKDNELKEINKLQKFYKFYLDNKSKISKEVEDSSHSKLIQLNILEAKNLKAKNDNCFSNPYFIVEVGGKEFESQVINQNINPSWDFSTVIFLKETDTIKITLWNKNTEKSVRFFKSSKDKFLGQIILTYDEIAKYYSHKKILDKWYVLQKRSSKSHVSGELRISFQFIDEQSLSISHSMFTFIPPNPNVCSRYLVETIINKELENAKKNNTRFRGFSKNAQTIFNCSTILWRVNKLYLLSKILDILLDEYISKNNIDAEVLYNTVLVDIKENEDIISPKENRKSIKQSLQRLYSYLTRHLTTFNEHYFETKNGTDLSTTIRLLEFIYGCKFSECYNEDPNYTLQFAESLIQKGIVAKYHSIHASINQDDPKLIRIIQLLPKIKEEISIYMDNFPRKETKLNIINNSIEYFINQINDDISEFKVNPNILKQDLTCSFEFIKELVELRDQCVKVDERFRYKINIDDYLIICVQEWLRITNIKANEWINNSIKLDEFKPQDENEYISTSVIDVFTYCNQILTYFVNISWTDKRNLKNCLIHMVMIINKSLTTYLDGMKTTIIEELENVRVNKFSRERIKYNNSSRKNFLKKAFTFTSSKSKGEEKVKEPLKIGSELIFEEESSLIVNSAKVCICLNNIAKCKQELGNLYERIEKVYHECEEEEEEEEEEKNNISTANTTKDVILKSTKNDDKLVKNINKKIENKYRSIFENRNEAYIFQPVQYINEKVESPFLNSYFITFSLMGTQNTLQNSAHTNPILKYISTNLNDCNIYYLELPKNNCTLDICIWHGNESAGFSIYEKTCIVINREDFIGQPMNEISIKFSDHSQLLVKIKLEEDFLSYYKSQIEKVIEDLLIDLQKILVKNMGGDICYSLGCILEKFENLQDIVKTRILNSEKMINYSEPLLNYLQYNLNIFFDKLNNNLDPINNIIYYIWLESLAIIKYSAIGELEYKPRSISYEHVSSLNYLRKIKTELNTDHQYSIYAPGRVFKGKLNERQVKYLSYLIEALKDLFYCGGAGIPNDKLEQKEFKEVKNILENYPNDNRKLKVIYNHHVERAFSLYDDLWILNLLTAKGSSRFIRVKLYEMKVKLENMLNGLNKKYESTVSFYENHKRIANSAFTDSNGKNINESLAQIPIDRKYYESCASDLDSNIGSPLMGNSVVNNSNSLSRLNIIRSSFISNHETNEMSKILSPINSNSIINEIRNTQVNSTDPRDGDSSASPLENGFNGMNGNEMMIKSSSSSNSERNMLLNNRTNSIRNLMYVHQSNNNSRNLIFMNQAGGSNRNLMMMNRNNSDRNSMMNPFNRNSSRSLMITNNNNNIIINNNNNNNNNNNYNNNNLYLNRNGTRSMDGNIDLNNIDFSKIGDNLYFQKSSSIIRQYEEIEYEFGYRNSDSNNTIGVNNIGSSSSSSGGSSNSFGNEKESFVIKYKTNSVYISNQMLNNNTNNMNSKFYMDVQNPSSNETINSMNNMSRLIENNNLMKSMEDTKKSIIKNKKNNNNNNSSKSNNNASGKRSTLLKFFKRHTLDSHRTLVGSTNSNLNHDDKMIENVSNENLAIVKADCNNSPSDYPQV